MVSYFLLLCPVYALAQTGQDSLLQIWWDVRQPDSLRYNALYQSAYFYLFHAPDSARMLAGWGIKHAIEQGQQQQEARALNLIGLSYRHQGDLAGAKNYYERSIYLSEKTRDTAFMAAVYGNLADIFRLQSNYPKAIDNLKKALSLAEASCDTPKMAKAYVAIATIYHQLPRHQAKSLELLEEAQRIYEKTGDDAGLALVQANLAAMYLDYEDYEKSQYFTEKALRWHEQHGGDYAVATLLINRSAVYSHQKKYMAAAADLKQASEIFKTLGDQEGLADAYATMGNLFLQQGNTRKAIFYARQALDLASTLDNYTWIGAQSAYCLYQAYQKMGNYKVALSYLETYIVQVDSLQHEETAARLKQMELEQQSASDSLEREKEKYTVELAHQSELRKKDKRATWLIVLGALAVVLAMALWVRLLYFQRWSAHLKRHSAELEKQQLQNEVALLKTQVNPHFLFNSLSILSSLIPVNPELSEQFLQQLAQSYRYILEQKDQLLVSLRTELEFIQSYAFLLTIRFEKKFVLEIRVSEADKDQYKIAPLTLQLLVENAVKHNRMSTAAPLVVDIFVEDGFFWVKNPFRPRGNVVTSTHTGLSNITNRYALLDDRPIWAGEKDGFFIVKIPLIQ